MRLKTPKKLAALVLMTALSASTVAAVPASAQTFSDVPSNHWAYQVINEISDQGLMVGTGTNVFSPGTNLTRAEYTTILYRLAETKSNGSLHDAQLNDVDADAWYAGVAEWGVTNGIIREINGNFQPNEPVTRELMADMTYRLIRLDYPDAIELNSTDAGYADETAISSQYRSVVNVLTNNGLLSGRGDNTFDPQGYLTRAEAAAMASRLMDIAEAQDPGDNPSEEPEQPEQPSEPSEEPDQPSEPSIPSEDPEQPSEDPEQPSEPSEEPETSADDPSDPSNWDLDGAPEWFLVGKTDAFTDEQWNDLIEYWADKEKPSDYPSRVPGSITTEEQAKAYFEYYQERLYDTMQEDDAKDALEAGTINLSEEEQKMVDLVNKARREAGVPELKISPALCEAANIRAAEGASVFSHTRPNGSPASSILKDIGLEYYGSDGQTNQIAYAENITYKKSSNGFTVEDTQQNFKDSAAHKKNMLSNLHQYIGIGRYQTGNKIVWVQVFGRIQ